MIVVLGLIIFVAAMVVGVAGVLGNGGSAHALSHGFAVFGFHVTGSAGALFLCGIVVGAVGLLGLSLLLVGARRTSRRGSAARRGLRQSRRETAAASQERDDLIGERDAARGYTASEPGNGAVLQQSPVGADDDRWSRLRGFRSRFAPVQAPAADSDSSAVLPDPDAPASVPASDVPAGASASAE
jgi:hypothetical protein